MTSSTDAQPALMRFDGPALDHDLGDGFALVRFEGEPTVVTDPSRRVLSAEQVRAQVALWTHALAAALDVNGSVPDDLSEPLGDDR